MMVRRCSLRGFPLRANVDFILLPSSLTLPGYPVDGTVGVPLSSVIVRPVFMSSQSKNSR